MDPTYLRRTLTTACGPLMNICTPPPLSQEPVEQPVPRPARRRSTRQTDRKLDGTVKVSSLMIDVIPEPVDIPVPTGLAGAKKSIIHTPPLVRQMTGWAEGTEIEFMIDTGCRVTILATSVFPEPAPPFPASAWCWLTRLRWWSEASYVRLLLFRDYSVT